MDSFFVQFNYLARNAVINGNAAAIAVRNVPTPVDFTATRTTSATLTVDIVDTANVGTFRVALHTITQDWDTVYTLTGNTHGVFPAPTTGGLYVSVAAVDAQQAESLFSGEKLILVTGTAEPGEVEQKAIQLFPNRPNPFDEATWISFWVNAVPEYRNAFIQISDIQGRIIEKIPVSLQQGHNEVLYTHGYGVRGTFAYSLLIDGQLVDSRQMVFAN